jgi:MFS family permease
VPGRLLVDTRPLRESAAFRRLWLGSGLSSVGGQLTSFAVALQVWTATHSSAAVGAISLASAAPAIALGLFGGAVADAVDRRRLVLATSACLALVSAALTVQSFAGGGPLWLLYALVAVQSLLNAVNGPARRTFLPRLLPADRLPAGAALTMLAMHASVTAGPLLAGALTATLGLRTCYLIDADSFTAALYATFRLPPMPPQPPPAAAHVAARPAGAVVTSAGAAATSTGSGGADRRRRWATVRSVGEALGFIRRDRVLTGAFLADASATVLGMPFALFPALNAAHFGGSPQTLGLLMAGPAIGGVLGSLLSGPVSRVSRHGRAVLIAGAAWGAALTGFALATTLWLAVAMLILAGSADVLSVVFRTTIVQSTTPDHYRGRVSAAEYVVGTACPQLGNFRAGAVATLTTPTTAALTGGLTTILAAALIRLTLPTFARYRASTADAAQALS